MPITSGPKKHEPKWYETPSGKFKLKLIITMCSWPGVGNYLRNKYGNVPGVIKRKRH